jgi:sulfur carrier protein
MQVEINGVLHILQSETTIAALLKKLSINLERGVAVALNDAVVPKSNFAATILKEGDRLEIIHATAGG